MNQKEKYLCGERPQRQGIFKQKDWRALSDEEKEYLYRLPELNLECKGMKGM